MALPVLTMEGTVVNEPELRFTPSGKAVVSFRIVSNKRKKQADGSWADDKATFLEVSAWDSMAENVSDSIEKGDSVIVIGELQQREYEDREGQKRTAFSIQAYNVGPSLKWNAAKLNRTRRETTSQRPRQQQTQASEADAWGVSQQEKPPF